MKIFRGTPSVNQTLFAVLFILLGYSFAGNNFAVVGPGHQWPMDQYSFNNVLLPSASSSHLPLVHPMVLADGSTPYLSQAGLHAAVYRGLVRLTGADAPSVLAWVQPIVAIAFAAALAGFLVLLRSLAGTAAILVSGLALALAPRLVLIASDPYWLPVLMLLPMLAALHGYGRVLRGSISMSQICAVVAACATVKFLCGYEFASILVIGVALAVPLCEPPERWMNLHVWLRTGSLGASVIAGFFIALALHAMQARLLLDADALAHLAATGTSRSVGSTHSDLVLKEIAPAVLGKLTDILQRACILMPCEAFGLTSLLERAPTDYFAAGMIIIVSYLFTDMFTLPGAKGAYHYLLIDGDEILFAYIISAHAIMLVTALAFRTRLSQGRRLFHLGLVAAVSLLAPLSWYMLAFGHSVIHGFVAATMLFFPWGILATVFVVSFWFTILYSILSAVRYRPGAST